MNQPLTIEPGKKIRLAEFDARWHHPDDSKDSAQDEIEENVAVADKLVYRLFAENRRALLIVLQGMDTSGKDGTIRSLLRGIDPLSCQITCFKAPTPIEQDHDFLWRIHAAVPRRGTVGVFNRSHYEDVVVVRVHKWISEEECYRRFDVINQFERLLVDGQTTILKFFLHISKEEQRERLLSRLNDPEKRWKFLRSDVEERKFWDEYQVCYDDSLTLCNTAYAPWYIVPADRKWNRNLIISRIVRRTLEKMNPHFPPASPDLEGITVD